MSVRTKDALRGEGEQLEAQRCTQYYSVSSLGQLEATLPRPTPTKSRASANSLGLALLHFASSRTHSATAHSCTHVTLG